MPRQSVAITSFNGGELSPRMQGRVDFTKYQTGCSVLENFIPLVQGPAAKRPGSHFVDAVLDATKRPWLGRFEFSASQSFVLEFCGNRLSFFTNRGRLAAVRTITGAVSNGGPNLIRITATAHGFFTGDSIAVASVGGVPAATGTWVITVITANTFDLVGSTFAGGYTAGGTATTSQYKIATPYADADLTNEDGGCALSMTQVGDLIYLAGGGQPPQKLARTSNTVWSLTEYQPNTGPFQDQNTTEATTIYASAQTGNVTLTASASVFTANMVGALLRLDVQDLSLVRPWEPDKDILANELRRSDGKTYKALNSSHTGTVRPTHSHDAAYDGSDSGTGVKWEYQDPGYGIVRLTDYTSSTSAKGDVITTDGLVKLPNAVTTIAGKTWRWSLGAWGAHNEYPLKVALWRERIAWVGARNSWFSVTGDYDDMSPDEFGQQVADSAVTVSPSGSENNSTRWIAPADALIIGTAGAEYAIAPQTSSDPFGPANRKATEQSVFGGRDVAAVKIGDAIAFVDASGRKVRETRYDVDANVYQSRDVTILSEHITKPAVIAMSYQAAPDNLLWAVRSDGVLLCFTYEREQEVYGWVRTPIAGGIVEDVQAIPAPDGSRDDLWLLVRRTVGGATVRYVEYLDAGYQSGDDIEDAFYVDCGLTYDGAPADTISGLGHLEGKTVAVLADGAAHPDCVVTAGAITLLRDASVVQVGLGYAAKLRTMRLEAGSADGTSQAKPHDIAQIAFRFIDTVGGWFGPSFDELDEILFRGGSDPMDQAIPPFSGDKIETWPGGSSTDCYVCLQHDQPLPCTLAAIFPRVSTGED